MHSPALIKAAFERDICDVGGSTLSDPAEQAEFYFAQKSDGSVPMPQTDHLLDFALGSEKEHNILLLTGTEGSGKSTVAAQCFETLQQSDCLLLAYVGGIGPDYSFGLVYTASSLFIQLLLHLYSVVKYWPIENVF